MPEVYSGMKDILLGYDTDLHFDNGDLMTTTGIDYIQREIYKLLVTNIGEWKMDENLGASPHRFVGQPNTREIAVALQKHVLDSIRLTISPAQVDVRAVPVSVDKLMLFIDIFILDGKVATIPFQFDFSGGLQIIHAYDPKVTPPTSSVNYKINDITNLQRPNKYWERLRSQ